MGIPATQSWRKLNRVLHRSTARCPRVDDDGGPVITVDPIDGRN